MTATKETVLWCNTRGCNTHVHIPNDNVGQARLEAREAGWSWDGSPTTWDAGDYCPFHTAKRRNNR